MQDEIPRKLGMVTRMHVDCPRFKGKESLFLLWEMVWSYYARVLENYY